MLARLLSLFFFFSFFSPLFRDVIFNEAGLKNDQDGQNGH